MAAPENGFPEVTPWLAELLVAALLLADDAAELLVLVLDAAELLAAELLLALEVTLDAALEDEFAAEAAVEEKLAEAEALVVEPEVVTVALPPPPHALNTPAHSNKTILPPVNDFAISRYSRFN
jgi:hypothetical protein